MMKAKDTVRLCPTTSQGWRINCDAKCHKAQAEITWDIAKQEGRREVVDWINKSTLKPFWPSFERVWQAQLIEWGLDAQKGL